MPDDIREVVAKLRELRSKATPGEWPMETVKTQVGICHKIGAFPTTRGIRPLSYACVYDDCYAGLDRPEAWNQEFLANAQLMHALVNALPTILDSLEAALADSERLKAALAEHGEHYASCPFRNEQDCDCGLARALKGFGAGC